MNLETELKQWTCNMSCPSYTISVVACPEDKTCYKRCSLESVCTDCEVPICSSCRNYMYRHRSKPPEALSNDMILGHPPREIYVEECTVLELLCASPCMTALTRFSIEWRYLQDRSLAQDAFMNRHRLCAKGNATTFPLPWEDLLSEFQRLDENLASNTPAGCLPHVGKALSDKVAVIIKMGDKKDKAAMRQHIIHQAVVRRRVVVQLIATMVARSHPAYRGTDMALVEARAEMLPDNDVPAEIIALLENDGSLNQVLRQKAATPFNDQMSEEQVSSEFGRLLKPNAVVLEKTTAGCHDLNAQHVSALEEIVTRSLPAPAQPLPEVTLYTGTKLLDQFQPLCFGFSLCLPLWHWFAWCAQVEPTETASTSSGRSTHRAKYMGQSHGATHRGANQSWLGLWLYVVEPAVLISSEPVSNNRCILAQLLRWRDARMGAANWKACGASGTTAVASPEGILYRCYRSTAPGQRRCFQTQICARPETDGAEIAHEHATYSTRVTRDTGSAKENAVRNPGNANSVWGTIICHLYARWSTSAALCSHDTRSSIWSCARSICRARFPSWQHVFPWPRHSKCWDTRAIWIWIHVTDVLGRASGSSGKGSSRCSGWISRAHTVNVEAPVWCPYLSFLSWLQPLRWIRTVSRPTRKQCRDKRRNFWARRCSLHFLRSAKEHRRSSWSHASLRSMPTPAYLISRHFSIVGCTPGRVTSRIRSM